MSDEIDSVYAYEVFLKQQTLLELLELTDDIHTRSKSVINFIKVVTNSPRAIHCVDFSAEADWINVEYPLSLEKDLKNRIVVLDFFTYCCINCLHILPTLETIEKYFDPKALTVIGVHSAKFDNERVLENVRNAVSRYRIHHPVMCDDGKMWGKMGISCWPTALILSPDKKIIFTLVGENNINKWVKFLCEETVNFYGSSNESITSSLPSVDIVDSNEEKSKLSFCFPGNISLSSSSSLIAVSDTGNNRLVVVNNEGNLIHVIGSGRKGFEDGNFDTCCFNAPQGLSWFGDSIIFIADTGNHAIRQVDLEKRQVISIAGNGKQGEDVVGGRSGSEQELNSPWDLCVVDDDKLFIAMAGCHQIWVLTLKATQILKRKYVEGVCVVFAGTSAEENRNNSYPHKAAFAQPSGLASTRIGEQNFLFVADSESSSIRQIDVNTGAVKALVGGSKNPLDLFSYGDRDGKATEVRLQHPLGVSFNERDNTLLLVDSYNHKVKEINIESRECISILGTGECGARVGPCLFAQLNEPGGIAYSSQLKLAYVADTNNHAIKMIDFDNNRVSELCVNWSSMIHGKVSSNYKSNMQTLKALELSLDGNLTINFKLRPIDGYYLTEGSPSQVELLTPYSFPFLCLTNTKQPVESFEHPVKFLMRPDEENESFGMFSLNFVVTIYVCKQAEGTCMVKRKTLVQPVTVNGKENVGRNTIDIVYAMEQIISQ